MTAAAIKITNNNNNNTNLALRENNASDATATRFYG